MLRRSNAEKVQLWFDMAGPLVYTGTSELQIKGGEPQIVMGK